jgi:hypothetical protein
LFAGGELGPVARWRIERHLQQCGACQDAVADFFHLQSEVSGLAEIPSLDWDAMARGIAARVRQEAPAEEKAPGWFAGPRVWQVGLATAALLCAIVVVRQFPQFQDGNEAAVSVAESKAFSDAAAPNEQFASARQEAAPEALLSPPPAGLVEDERAPGSGLARPSNETSGESAGSLGNAATAERSRRDGDFSFQIASQRGISPDVQAGDAPATEAASGQASSVVSNAEVAQSLADRSARSVAVASDDRTELEKADSGLGQQRLAVAELRARTAQATPAPAAQAPAAPPPPAPPSGQRAEAEADAGTQRDQAVSLRAGQGVAAGAANRLPATTPERRNIERAEIAQAARSTARPSQAVRAQEPGLAAGDEDDWTQRRGFTALPAALEDPRVDVGVAADGWISIRSVDASTGTITITDVYVP